MANETKTTGAWNCHFCHATNVTARCGCGPSRAAERISHMHDQPAISVDQIHMDLPARRPVRLTF